MSFDLRVGLGPASEDANPFGLVGGETRELGELWSGSKRTDDPEFAQFLTDLATAARGGSIRL
ncbi:MAG: hypothetical protein ACI9OJ_001049, partial [Myxococcota bacterium]